MSQGHLPNQGLYGPEVAKGMRFLLAVAREDDGYLVGARGGNMYCHGMATLCLAELWGMTGDDDIKPVLKKAVDLIVNAEPGRGAAAAGAIEPAPPDADISVTIMQVMALRAAKNAGLHVPDADAQEGHRATSRPATNTYSRRLHLSAARRPARLRPHRRRRLRALPDRRVQRRTSSSRPSST